MLLAVESLLLALLLAFSLAPAPHVRAVVASVPCSRDGSAYGLPSCDGKMVVRRIACERFSESPLYTACQHSTARRWYAVLVLGAAMLGLLLGRRRLGVAAVTGRGWGTVVAWTSAAVALALVVATVLDLQASTYLANLGD
ncbi:MAG: hypothetical protein M3P04_08440 [Actinomycetota bacterium]|nr:hypothetical protein [Actinomycetota bacterium]